MSPLEGVPDVRLDVRQLPYGSPGVRLLAALIDGVLLVGLLIGFAIISNVAAGVAGWDVDDDTPDGKKLEALQTLWFHVIVWLYYAILECSPMQGTLRKRALGLVVTDLRGDRIGFLRATGRYFGKFISQLLCGLGFFKILWDPTRQGWHDGMAGTLVLAGRPGVHHALPDLADAFPAPRDDQPPPSEDITARPR
jgi:uncharacterized RDD family membrane protein YckC